VRSLLQDVILTRANESLAGHIFAISHELSTGNAHSACAAFERALSSPVCAHHTGLWISYIRLCHARKELRGAKDKVKDKDQSTKSKAKDIFYRAIQACPWSKDVFMEAFGTLVRDMDSTELKSVYSTMCQKGFRIHVDLDEFVDRWRREYRGGAKEKERERERRKERGDYVGRG